MTLPETSARETIPVPRESVLARFLRFRRGPWEAAIKGVQDTASSGENLMPRILAAVEASATVGEISDAMRRVYGEYREEVVI